MTYEQDIIERIAAEEERLSRAFRQIAEFVRSNADGFIHRPIRQLAEDIGVSEPSLIRFSRHFGYKGVPDLRLAIAMSLAGADKTGAYRLEPALADKEMVNRQAKMAIAQTASSLLREDTSVLLDSGSTVFCLTRCMPENQPLRIMTTGLKTLLSLNDLASYDLMLPGGMLRPNAMSLSGRMVEKVISEMLFDTVYLGADSIDPAFGLSTFSEEEAHLNRAMIEVCQRVVVLADASKFRSPALHRICTLSKVDILVTGADLPVDVQQAVADHGTEVMLAPLSTEEEQNVDTVQG